MTDYSPKMLEMLARRRKYDEWRGEDADNGSVERDTAPVLRRIYDGERNRTQDIAQFHNSVRKTAEREAIKDGKTD